MEMLYNDSKERQVRSVSNLGLNNLMKETYLALSRVLEKNWMKCGCMVPMPEAILMRNLM